MRGSWKSVTSFSTAYNHCLTLQRTDEAKQRWVGGDSARLDAVAWMKVPNVTVHRGENVMGVMFGSSQSIGDRQQQTMEGNVLLVVSCVCWWRIRGDGVLLLMKTDVKHTEHNVRSIIAALSALRSWAADAQQQREAHSLNSNCCSGEGGRPPSLNSGRV